MYSTNLTITPLAIEGNVESLESDSAVLRSHGLAEYNTATEIASAMGIISCPVKDLSLRPQGSRG
ncbi:RNA-directed DNA polymerase [Nostoc linckia NIES-25]|nr:RNA-directed DNA polymerase [Nostoc linckia NIES-25]